MSKHIDVIDSHLHLWDISQPHYTWLKRDSPLYRTFEPADVEDALARCGVGRIVLVQAADCHEDTAAMIKTDDEWARVAGVVGWIPIDEPDRAAEALNRLEGRICGVRYPINVDSDPHWLRRANVLDGLRLLASHDLPLDWHASVPLHLDTIPYVVEAVPELRIVINHLGRPPITAGTLEPWQSLLGKAARYGNVSAKISGLGTVPGSSGSVHDLKPYFETAVDLFGCERLMFGSDWPVALLGGSYELVFKTMDSLTSSLDDSERSLLFGGTAIKTYGLS